MQRPMTASVAWLQVGDAPPLRVQVGDWVLSIARVWWIRPHAVILKRGDDYEQVRFLETPVPETSEAAEDIHTERQAIVAMRMLGS